jgi:hypothetical protein
MNELCNVGLLLSMFLLIATISSNFCGINELSNITLTSSCFLIAIEIGG